MRFLVDAQLPPALAQFLQSQGHEAKAVREVGLREACDADIWIFAEQGGWVLFIGILASPTQVYRSTGTRQCWSTSSGSGSALPGWSRNWTEPSLALRGPSARPTRARIPGP